MIPLSPEEGDATHPYTKHHAATAVSRFTQLGGNRRSWIECIDSELRRLNEAMAPVALEKLENELWAMFPLGRGLGGCWIGGTNYR